MDANELRALAYALERGPFDSYGMPPDAARKRAADYLRAQADAQPVAEVQSAGAILFEPLPLGTKLYTHPAPAVPAIEERGPWSAGQDKQQAWEQRVWIESDDFTHDVRLYVNGDFESHDQRFAYAQEIARRLNAASSAPAGWKWVPVEPTPEMLHAEIGGKDWNGKTGDERARALWVAMLAAAPAVPHPSADASRDAYEGCREDLSDWKRRALKAEREARNLVRALADTVNGSVFMGEPAVPQAEPIDPHMIVAEDRFPDVPAEQWVTCSQCGEDVDRECPICDGLGRVLATDSEQAEPKPTPASGDDLGVYKGMADSYRNDAEPTGAPYGIIDPDYGRVYTIARKLAWEEGYAIGLHGSFTRDLDLIAVPWTERACDPEHLIRRIVDATGLKLRDGVAVKPHGRRAWTLLFPAFGDPRFVDLSVMPRIGGSDAD